MYGFNVSTFCSWRWQCNPSLYLLSLSFDPFTVCALGSDLMTGKIVWCNKCRLEFNSCIVRDSEWWNDLFFIGVCEYWFLFGFIVEQCILRLTICIFACFQCALFVTHCCFHFDVAIVMWTCVDVDTHRHTDVTVLDDDDTMIRWWWCNGSWPAVDLSNALPLHHISLGCCLSNL